MFSEHFGLLEDPFSLAPDYSFFSFDACNQDQCLQILQDFRENEGTVILTGPPGSGKTLFLRNFLMQLAPDVRSIAVSDLTSEELSADGFYSEIAIIQDYRSKEISLRSRIESITAAAVKEEKLLIAIDDAHRIDDDTLKYLLAMSARCDEGAPFFQLLLCGLETLEQRVGQMITSDFWGDLRICRYHLQEWPEPIIAKYVQYRAHQAGYDGTQDLFDEDAIKMVSALSNGIPYNIHLLCRSAISLAERDRQNLVGSSDVFEASKSCFVSRAHPSASQEEEIHAQAPQTPAPMEANTLQSPKQRLGPTHLVVRITRWKKSPANTASAGRRSSATLSSTTTVAWLPARSVSRFSSLVSFLF